MSDDRLYIKVHNGMPDHPKIEVLSDAAFRLLVSLWCWCDRHDQDGEVPLPVWDRRGSKRSRRELLDGQLAHIHPDHVELHDYLEHQRSAEQKQAAKDRARTAGQAGGLAKAKRRASDSLSDSSSKNVAEVEVEKKKASPKGRRASPDEPPRIDARAVVAAYVEGSRSGGRGDPTDRMRSRVGKDANRLLGQVQLDRLVAAARSMGESGWHDLDVQLQRMPPERPDLPISQAWMASNQ